MESQRQYHEMANVANAVSYNISALVENAGEIAKSMYTNRRVNSFLEKQYESNSDYYAEYQNFFQDSTLENVLGMNQIVFTMYTDNPTVVKGGKIDNISNLKKTVAYKAWRERGDNEGLFSCMRMTDMRIRIIVKWYCSKILIFFERSRADAEDRI